MSGLDTLACPTGTLYGDMVLSEGVFSIQTGAVKAGYNMSNQFPVVGLNEVGSGVLVKLVSVSVGFVSGPMTPGEIFIGFGTATSFLGSFVGQPVTAFPNLVGTSTFGSKFWVTSGQVNGNVGVNANPDRSAAWGAALMPQIDMAAATQPRRATSNLSCMFVLAPGNFMTLSLYPRPFDSSLTGFVSFGVTWVEEALGNGPSCYA